MSIIIYCAIAAALLIMISKMPVAMAMSKCEGGYDNRYRRDQQATLSGFGKRALAAHQNTLEAFPLFGVSLAIALMQSSDIALIQTLCLTFVGARLLYLVFYWCDVHFLRSTVWSVGFIACIWLMATALP